MFRRWPFFQRLLSWTKPHAPVERGTRAYERYDWNSLLGETPETRAIQPELMDGTSYFPSRPEMEANLVAFAERAKVGDPIRLPLDGDAAGRGRRRSPIRGRDDRRRVHLHGAGRRGRGCRAEDAARPRHGAHVALRRRSAGRDVRRQARLHHRQAELRVRAGDRPPALGEAADPVVAVPGAPVGRHPVARRDPGALRAAVRGSRPRRRGQRARRGDRPDRASRRRHLRGPAAADRRWRGHGRRGGRGDRRDRLRHPAGRPAGARGRDLRGERAAGPDAVVGKREPARGVLCRDDRPGRQGAPEARHPGQFRGRPRSALQRQGARRVPGEDAVRHRAGAAARGPQRRVGVSRPGAGGGSRALPPARLPGPGPDRRSCRRSSRRRRPAAGGRPRCRRARRA